MKRVIILVVLAMTAQLVGCGMVSRAIDYNIEYRDRSAKVDKFKPVSLADRTKLFYGGVSPWWRIPNIEGLRDHNYGVNIDMAAKNLFNDFIGRSADMTAFTDCDPQFLKLKIATLGPVSIQGTILDNRFGPNPNDMNFETPQSRRTFFTGYHALGSWYIEPSYGDGSSSRSGGDGRDRRHGGANPQIMRPDPDFCWEQKNFQPCGNIKWIQGREVNLAPPLSDTDLMLYTQGADAYLYAYNKDTHKIMYLHTEGKTEDVIGRVAKACKLKNTTLPWMKDAVETVKAGGMLKRVVEPGKSAAKQRLQAAVF